MGTKMNFRFGNRMQTLRESPFYFKFNPPSGRRRKLQRHCELEQSALPFEKKLAPPPPMPDDAAREPRSRAASPLIRPGGR
jgi:hypothetical protein